MRERGDLDCAHEPFMYYYYVDQNKRQMPHFQVRDDLPSSYIGIRDMLLERAEKQPVFFKDMSYAAMPRILDDVEFCRRLTNCFLIRDPVASIVSYHKLDTDVTCEEIGLEAQWLHYQALEALTGSSPVIVQAESVRNDIKGIVSALWSGVGLPYMECAFDWNQGQSPKEWEQVAGWHGEVTSSKGIRPISAEEVQKQQTIFNERAAEFPQLNDFLAHYAPFYGQLKARALTV